MKAETERLIGRLMSSDPDFDDCTDAANLLRRYYRDSHGPDGLPWKDAAVSERVRRVAVEQQNADLREALDEAVRSLESISNQAGIDEYMNEFCEVRGYAQSRAWSARKALASQPTPEPTTNRDREDAERYRHLKASGAFRAMSLDMGGQHTWTGIGRPVGVGSTLDAAIDAARAGEDV